LPLEAIAAKESEIRQQIETARQQAAAELDAARRRAKQAVLEADAAGKAEADAMYKHGITQAERQAAAIVADAQNQAALLRQKAEANLDSAAAKLTNLVLLSLRAES
jgi:vacuolar-type H+-ATPase subunit H